MNDTVPKQPFLFLIRNDTASYLLKQDITGIRQQTSRGGQYATAHKVSTCVGVSKFNSKFKLVLSLVVIVNCKVSQWLCVDGAGEGEVGVVSSTVDAVTLRESRSRSENA